MAGLFTATRNTLLVAAFFMTWNSVNSVNSIIDPLPAVRHDRSAEAQQSDRNIAFDLPDLTTTMELPDGSYQLEAFKSINNDQILREAGVPRVSQLYWVSVGQPTLVETSTYAKPNAKQLFHFSKSGFHTYIQMLTPSQREKLVSTAKAKYNLTVGADQVVNLILSKFACSLLLNDEANNKYLIRGEVTNFRSFPLRMEFVAPTSSVERRLFAEFVASTENLNHLKLSCVMASRGKVVRTNTLKISSRQIQQIGLDAKLFGPSSKGRQEVYVTRQQTSQLSNEMYSTLNIIEDYEMPESSFSEAFVDGLIQQIAVTSFTMEPVDRVLETLSAYGFDVSEDLRPDVIKRDLGQILKVEDRGSKQRIVLDESNYGRFDESQSNSGGFSVGGSYGLFSVQASANWANANSKSSETDTRSLDDQLRELNTASRNDIKWEIEGERIVPKSLNVAKLSRSNLDKTLAFDRVRIQKMEAPFSRKVRLYARRAIASAGTSDSLTLLSSRIKKMSLENEVSRSIFRLRQDFTRLSSRNNELSNSISRLSQSVRDLQRYHPRPGPCPAGFTYRASVNGCYKAVLDNLNWSDAGAKCRSLHNDAHLVVINNAKEQQDVAKLLDEYTDLELRGCWKHDWGHPTGPFPPFWTAGQRYKLNGAATFVWRVESADRTGGGQITRMSYTNWKLGEPNDRYSNENCMELLRGRSSAFYYTWNDFTCSKRLCSVCELDL